MVEGQTSRQKSKSPNSGIGQQGFGRSRALHCARSIDLLARKAGMTLGKPMGFGRRDVGAISPLSELLCFVNSNYCSSLEYN